MPAQAKQFRDYDDAMAWFGEQVRRTSEVAQIGEPAVAAAVDERLIQCIWHEGALIGRSLATATGKPVTILNPGDWNHEAGPDFRRAEITFDGRVVKGDVEIHVNASDWSGHGHDRDFDYNSVVLHAFFEQDDQRRTDTLHNGRPLERLRLSQYLEPDLETLRKQLALDDYPTGESTRRGRCAETIDALDPETLCNILDLAGDQRLERKAARYAAQLGGDSLDQVFFQALMSSMGHKSGKALYFLLAKRAPIAEIADYARDCAPGDPVRLIEAILYHVGNLMPEGEAREALDEPSQQYLDELNRHWSRVAGYFADRIIPPTRRWNSGIRPVNFPTRRLAGVAWLIGPNLKRGILDAVLNTLWAMAPGKPDRKSVKRMAGKMDRALAVDIDHYWTRRYVWGGKLTTHKQSLIGRGQARSLLFNAILPIALLAARRESNDERAAKVFALWRNFPTLSENRVVRLMRERLFGDDDRVAGLFTTEHRNQALFQIFEDCCNNYMNDCARCSLLQKA